MPMNQLNSLANVKPEKWVQPTSTGSGVLRLVVNGGEAGQADYGHPEATLKPPSGYLQATLRLP